MSKTFVQISFENDEISREKALQMLLCAERKKSALIKIALEELISKYEINPEDPNDVKGFIANYKYIRKVVNKYPTDTSRSIMEETHIEKKEAGNTEAPLLENNEVSVSSKDINNMKQALALFA